MGLANQSHRCIALVGVSHELTVDGVTRQPQQCTNTAEYMLANVLDPSQEPAPLCDIHGNAARELLEALNRHPSTSNLSVQAKLTTVVTYFREQARFSEECL